MVRLGELDQFATTFKRVFFERDTAGDAVAVRLVPLNPAHPERRVPLDQVTGIYPLMYRLVPGRSTPAREAEPAKRTESFTTTRLSIEND